MAWVEKRQNGTWVGRYKEPKAGRNLTAGTSTSKRDALRMAQDQEAKIRAGSWVNPRDGRMPFSEYFETLWLPNRLMEMNTVSNYQSHYRTALKPEFGDVALNRIVYEKVQGWVTRMHKEGVSPRTIQARFRTLQTVLAAPNGGMSALRSRLIAINPCQGIDLPAIAPRQVTIYEPEEVDLILEVMDPYWAPLPLLASELGIRWGELMGLRTTDFGLGMRTVAIQRTVVELSKELTGNGTRFAYKPYPKSQKPRVLPLGDEAGAALAEIMAERGLRPGDRLFSRPATWPRRGFVENYAPARSEEWPDGVPVSRAAFRQSVWLPTIAAAQKVNPNLPVRRVHDLRASKISWLLFAGVDTPTVMQFAGHAHLQTTERYVGVMADAHDRILAADASLRKRRKLTVSRAQ